MKSVLLLLLLVGLLSGQDFGYERQRLLLPHRAALQKMLPPTAQSQNETDAQYYHLYLDIRPAENLLEGEIEAWFKVRGQAISTLQLDAGYNLQIQSVSGAAVNYQHNQNVLNLTLDRSYQPGELVQVLVRYQLILNSVPDQALVVQSAPNGSPRIWTLSEPYGAKFWWPCKDTPADKADSLDVIVRLPQNLDLASNGRLLSLTDSGVNTKTWHWQEKYPITTYLVSLAIAEYETFTEPYIFADSLGGKTMPLEFYIYPEDLAAAQAAALNFPLHLDVFNDLFGIYPFADEKYGMAQFGWGGGMEHQTISSIGPVSASNGYLHVHELAHQWFGDRVTCASWQDIWLNEGFASYAEALYAEAVGFGDDQPGPDALHAYMQYQIYTGSGTIFITDTTSVSNIFSRVVYDKAAWLLHMLRHQTGDAVFFEILRTYISDLRWSYGSVRTADFIETVETVSGREFSWFFDQWLYQEFYPEYVYRWSADDSSGGFEIKLHITQNQSGAIFTMPLDCRVSFTNGSDTTFVVWNNLRSQEYNLWLPASPIEVVIDPDNWVLSTKIMDISRRDTEQMAILRSYPNPFKAEVTIEVTCWQPDRPEVVIFDLHGREVCRLSGEPVSQELWLFRWDGRSGNGFPAAAGLYLARPAAVGESPGKAAKILLVR